VKQHSSSLYYDEDDITPPLNGIPDLHKFDDPVFIFYVQSVLRTYKQKTTQPRILSKNM
jgi:hypothetical protein